MARVVVSTFVLFFISAFLLKLTGTGVEAGNVVEAVEDVVVDDGVSVAMAGTQKVWADVGDYGVAQGAAQSGAD